MSGAPDLPALLERQAELHGPRPALSVGDAAPLTYAAWWARACAVARRLHPRVRREDLVALPFPASEWPAFGIAYFACQLAGAVPVVLRAGMTADEWGAVLRGCAIAHVLVPGGDDRPPVPAGTGIGWWRLDQLAGPEPGPPGAAGRPAVEPSEVADVLLTSGTTGTSKPVATDHAELVGGSRLPAGWAGATLVHAMGPATAAGVQGAMLLALKSGLHATTVAPVQAAGLVAKIRDPSARAVLLVPSVAIMALRGGLLGTPVPHVRMVMLMGAATPRWVMEELRPVFPGAALLSHYGSTEAGAAQLLMPFDPERPDVVGRALGDTDVRIVAGGRSLPAGQVGEIHLRRRGVPQRRYLHDATASANVFAADGWVSTGDLGHLDDGGFLHVLDRQKDIVIRGGQNIAPSEVEAALAAHPAVDEAAAFGVPHPTLGEMLVAAVVLRPGAQTSPLDLRRSLRSRLAQFKIPSRIEVVDALPRNAMGKVEKRRLRATYSA